MSSYVAVVHGRVRTGRIGISPNVRYDVNWPIFTTTTPAAYSRQDGTADGNNLDSTNTSLDDCKHIALATIAHADALVSWNFTHIVNLDLIKGYNGVNMMLGYSQLEIRTPEEVANAEN